MKRDSILASVTGLFDSSTWAGKQGGAPRASLPPADTPPMPHACSKTMSFPNPSLNTFTERLVLVAEDEPGIVGVLEAYLRRDGFRTCSAMDGVEAMRLFRELRPDAVLLDVNLPGMDGLDVLRAIRDEGQTPVIIVTALADDVDKLLGLRLARTTTSSNPSIPPRSWRACGPCCGARGACERRAHPRRRHRDRRAGPRRGRARGRRALRAAATDADRVPPAGLPGIPAAALLLARIPDRALPAGKRRA